MRRGVLLYLSGLGLGREFLQPRQTEDVEVIVPTWIAPLSGETIHSYARRLASSLHRADVTHIAGVSFGGVLALEMAHLLNVKGVIVVSGILSPAELPWHFRLLKPLSAKSLGVLLDLALLLAAGISSCCGKLLPRNPRAFFHWFKGADKTMVKWGSFALLRWQPTYNLESLSILQIHGAADGIFPKHSRGLQKAVIDGGHVLTATHPETVNQCIFDFIAEHPEVFPAPTGIRPSQS